MAMKVCTGCKVEKDETMFVRDRRRDRRKARCLSCTSAASKEWRRRQPEYEKNRYRLDRQGARERHLIRKYGVTQPDYDVMFAAQNGCCAICRRSQDRAFDIDHDHQTGEVRGLLCTNCNRMI